MRLTPREPEIPEVGGFTDANDIFGYRNFADKLANLVRNIDEPLVIVQDGPWGSGKSTFVKQWAGLMRERGAPVILFDAFGNDHYEDAFLAISAEIHNTAKEALGGSDRTTRRYFNRAKRAGMVLAPIALRVASRAATAGLLTLDDVENAGEALKAAAKALGDEGTKALEAAVAERLRNAGKERAVLDAFRETLTEVAAALAQREDAANRHFPLVFIIDELDRCRPPFALSVIERVKHLFSVPSVCFVLVTHLPQLAQAVQGAYGATFDAKTYLEKFYHLRITLPENTNRGLNHRSAYVSHLWRSLEIAFADRRYDELVERQLRILIDIYELSLRQLERVMIHVALACAAAGPRQLVLAPLLAGLCIMRHTHPDLFRKARNKNLTWDEALSFLQPPGRRVVDDEWALGFWRYATGAEMTDEEIREFGRGLARYHLDDRADILAFTASYVEDLDQRREVNP